MGKYHRVDSLYDLYEFCELCEPRVELAVGRITRVGTINHPYSKNGAVLLNGDGSIVAWNFENPELKALFTPKKERALTEAERKSIEEQIKAAKNALAKKQAALFQSMAKKAYAFYRSLDGCYANKHPYLQLKKVRHTGAMRVSSCEAIEKFFGYKLDLKNPVLVIPLTDGQQIQSLQFIDSEGQKRFLNHARKKGCYWLSQWRPEEPQRVAIAEGVATALSVKEHLSKTSPQTPFVVLAAMDCGNLANVALNARKKYPQAEINIFADNDRNQAGIKAAQDAVDALQSRKVSIYLPTFSTIEIDVFKEKHHDINKYPTDFNDKAYIGLEKIFSLDRPYKENRGYER